MECEERQIDWVELFKSKSHHSNRKLFNKNLFLRNFSRDLNEFESI